MGKGNTKGGTIAMSVSFLVPVQLWATIIFIAPLLKPYMTKLLFTKYPSQVLILNLLAITISDFNFHHNRLLFFCV